MTDEQIDAEDSASTWSERRPMSELQAIRLWHLRADLSADEREIALTHASKKISDYREKAPYVPQTMLPVLWLRLLREVGLSIDDEALDILQELEHEREAAGKVRLYLYSGTRDGKDKKFGREVKGIADRKLLGRTTLEMLVGPAPRSLDYTSQGRWPYGEQWTAKVRSKTPPTPTQRQPKAHYLQHWRGTTEALEECLKKEVASETPLVRKVGGSKAVAPYRTSHTRQELTDRLKAKYPELADRSSSTILKVLSCFIAFDRGAPLSSKARPNAK